MNCQIVPCVLTSRDSVDAKYAFILLKCSFGLDCLSDERVQDLTKHATKSKIHAMCHKSM